MMKSQPDYMETIARSLPVNEIVPDHEVQPGKVELKPLYTAADIAGLAHLDSLPGAAPFLRGPYKTMYTQKPWTIRQYAGFANADDTNRLFREALAQGSQGLSVAFDLPTHRGYDSDHPLATADVGMAGVAIDSVEDMKRLMANIPLDKVSVSMTMSGAVLPVMAAFIVAAEEMGFPAAALSGTIQNDIVKEFMVRNTYIFSPVPSMRIATDVVEYIAQHMPRFNAMSISGYHFQEAGADTILELALTLANGRAYAKEVQQRGLDMDQFCGQLSFFFGVGSDFYMEIAKLRAARVLWCEIVEILGAKSDKAKALRMHCQTSGWSLASQEPANNIARTTMQAMAAVFGGTQSLHTNAYDEAISLPTEGPSRLARNTQLIMQKETGLCEVVDPWAGSYMMESLTAQVMAQVRCLMAEIDAQGGVIAALESGWVNARIQAHAASVQANIDKGEHVIVGLNQHGSAHRQSSAEMQPEYLSIDSQKVRDQQLERLTHLRSNRDELAVKRTLKAMTEMARTQSGNLLELTIQAIRARATLGECTAALEQVWPRHVHSLAHVAGIYHAHMHENEQWRDCCARVLQATKKLGRQPRILITKIGQDGHDRGAKIIAASLHDAGFEVHLAPLFQTQQHIVDHALRLGVDILGVSTLAGAHLQLLPEPVNRLEQQSKKIPVVAGGVIPEAHIVKLKTQGVTAVFSPGENMATIINTLIDKLNEEL
jgi:methylmalonyl-CoA mutase